MLGFRYMLVTLHSMRSKLCALRPEIQKHTAHGGTDAAGSAQKA